MKNFITVIVSALISFVVVMGGYYAYYVEYSKTPYDEVGTGLSDYMPAPVRAWGCARIKERFPNTLPPYGCQENKSRDTNA